jgi:glycine cleavage system H protein
MDSQIPSGSTKGAGAILRPDYWYLELGLWLAVNESRGTLRIGLADDRQRRVGPIRSVDFAEAGMSVEVGDDLAYLGTDADDASVSAPLDGIVVAVNRRLLNEPELVNRDPYGAGWIVEMRPAQWPLVGVLDSESYRRLRHLPSSGA